MMDGHLGNVVLSGLSSDEMYLTSRWGHVIFESVGGRECV